MHSLGLIFKNIFNDIPEKQPTYRIWVGGEVQPHSYSSRRNAEVTASVYRSLMDEGRLRKETVIIQPE